MAIEARAAFSGRLSSADEKLAMLMSLGLDELVIVPSGQWWLRERFRKSREYLELVWPREFLQWLKEAVGASELWVGNWFADPLVSLISWQLPHLVEAMCDAGILLQAVPLLADDSEPISRTRISNAILTGDVATAARLLGRPFAVAGKPVSRDSGYFLKSVGLVQPVAGDYAARVAVARDCEPQLATARVGPRVQVYDPWSLTVELPRIGSPLGGQIMRVELLDRLASCGDTLEA